MLADGIRMEATIKRQFHDQGSPLQGFGGLSWNHAFGSLDQPRRVRMPELTRQAGFVDYRRLGRGDASAGAVRMTDVHLLNRCGRLSMDSDAAEIC